MRFILFQFVLLLTFSANAFSQSLADVLSSVQERKIAVEQRRQVIEDYESYSIPPAQIEPIDWVVTPEKYPTTGGIASLSMEDRVKALNIAIREFDVIKTQFLNIEKSSLASEALAPAQLVEYTEFDLPSPGRADHNNYHSLLQALAVNVLKLTTLHWPYEAGTDSIGAGEIIESDYEPNNDITTWPTSVSMTTEPVLPEDLFGNYYDYYGFKNKYATDLMFVGAYGDGGDYGLGLIGEIVTHTLCWLKSEHAPAPSGGVQWLAGEVVLLAQDFYNPGTGFTRDGITPSLDGRYKRILSSEVEANQQDAVELIVPAQEMSVEGAWHDFNGDGWPTFVPNGVSLAAVLAANPMDDSEVFDIFQKGYGTFFTFLYGDVRWEIGHRKYQCVMMPEFVKGLDAAPETIEALRNLPSAGVSDPLVKVAPSPSVLLAIDLGEGSKNTSGYGGIGILHPKFHLNHHDDSFISFLLYGDGYYLDPELRLDYEPVDHSFASELVFMGSTEDFHVHYETRRGAEFRAPLPEWSNVPGNLEEWDTEVHGWKTAGNFLTAWDRPRLRQVVGKHIATDIKYGATPSDYERIVTIRRVPAGADLTPGEDGLIDTSEFPTIRILTLKNSGHANGWAGTDKFSLEITDSLNGGDEKWTIKANDPTADPGLDDWTLEAKKGTTLSAKTKHQWDDENNKLTTAIWSGAGTNPATTTKTLFPVDEDWFDPLSKPTSLTLQPETAEQIVTSFEYSGTAHYTAHLPSKITITDARGTDREIAWQNSGIMQYSETGDGESPEWRTDYSIEDSGNTVKATRKFKGSTVGTNWVEWTSETEIKSYSAPDGTVSLKTDDKCTLQTMTLYGPTATPIPWAVEKSLNKDGTGSFHSYTQDAESITFTTKSGLVSGSTISEGSQTIHVFSNGHPVSSATHAITGGEPEVLLNGEVWSEPNAWGAPTKRTSTLTGLFTTWTHDGAWMRITGSTNALGVTTDNLTYDAIGRATNYIWNGNSGSISFTDGGKTIQNTLPIGTLGDRGWSQTSDGVGNPLTSRAEGGQPIEVNNTYPAGQLATQVTNTATEATITSTSDANDGSLLHSTGNALPFGGLDGSALAVEEGLLKSQTALGDLAASFQTTWTDAWGRLHKSETTGTAEGTDITHVIYSSPTATTKREIILHASGKRMIEETESWIANGSIHRSGLDLDKNGQLDGNDRFVTTTTSLAQLISPPLLAQDVIRTTITQNGNTTALMVRDFNPANGITVTTLNGGEDEFTETPDFPNKTSQVIHKKSGVVVSTKDIALNHLGQTDQEVVSGTGIPATTINPTIRADGSVEAVSVTIGGAVATATYTQDGKLSGMSHPLLGNLPVSHGFANGIEILAVDGTTASKTLDGAASSLSGAGVMARSRSTAIAGGNFEHTINPATGASTTLVANPAGAKVLHQYAAGENPAISWFPGGLLKDVSLGRPGAGTLDFGYSNDGAKDLISITWPQVSSAGFPDEHEYFPGGSIGMTHRDAAGNITTLVDPSGTRQLAYEKNRLTSTDWQGGALNPYKVVREYDDNGRTFKVSLHRDNSVIHEITPAYTGESRETSGVAASGFAAAITRDAESRHVTGFTRGGVTQSWGRGTAGQITAAGSNVSGAPSFTYASFDSKGRRKTVQTNRGTWNYDYRGGANGDGQLDSASNGTLNADFEYNFDGIGRRPQFAGNANALNQFVALENALTPKNLYITADPAARLWVNNTEMTPFEGGWTYSLGHPGATGGWVPWTVKGVLEGEGDVGAFADAVAVKSGLAWFPPQYEEFTFDADGNRESSALWNYGWDGRNRLVRARTKEWDTDPQGWDVKFDYDAEGRRFKKEITRYEGGQIVEQKTVYFVWDGWDLLYERHEDNHGNQLFDRKYVWGPDIADGHAGGAGGLLLIREKRGSTTKDFFPLYDGTGHCVGLTDSAGNLVAEYWWGPFGELLEAKGEMADANPFRYATKYFDTETGLYYFGHRYYDPQTGTWLSREILGEDESLNLYAYCHNDPLNRIDVLGLKERNLIYQFFFGIDPIVSREHQQPQNKIKSMQKRRIRSNY
jgi:RHS repeat-associated protein